MTTRLAALVAIVLLFLPGLGGDLCDSYVRRLAAVAQEVGWQVCGEECLSMSVGAAVYWL